MGVWSNLYLMAAFGWNDLLIASFTVKERGNEFK